MNVRKLALYACAGVMALPLVANAASPARPGKWKVTTQMDMPGMPMKMPPITVETCVTQEQVEKNGGVPDAGKDCKIGDYKVDGNTITWSVSCPKQKVSGTGTVTYDGDSSYTGTMDMKMGEQAMTAKYSAKRMGDCDK